MEDTSDLVDLQSNIYDLRRKLADQQDKINKYKRKIQRQSQEKSEMSERINALMKSNMNLQEEMQRQMLQINNRPSQDQHPEYDQVPSEDEDNFGHRFYVDPDKSHKTKAKKMKDDRPELLKRIDQLSQLNNDLMIQMQKQVTEHQNAKDQLLNQMAEEYEQKLVDSKMATRNAETEVMKLRACLQEAEDKASELEGQNMELQNQMEELHTTHQQEMEEVRLNTIEISTYEQRLEQLQKTLTQKIEQLDELNKQYKEERRNVIKR